MKMKKPEPNRPVMVTASDFMGDFQYIAEWVPYSLNGPKRQHGKGRWMKRNESGKLERVQRKELPDSWRELTMQEFVNYYGLGPEDLEGNELYL
jgi:hypothetical protein